MHLEKCRIQVFFESLVKRSRRRLPNDFIREAHFLARHQRLFCVDDDAHIDDLIAIVAKLEALIRINVRRFCFGVELAE